MGDGRADGGGPGRVRTSQQDRSATTRAALLATGRDLFARHGYAEVSAEQIVTAAGMTRGALYHHHRHKRDLFRAVVEDLEAEVTVELTAMVDAAAAAEAGIAVLGGYLDLCRRPDVARILLVDAPAVLGWQEWRAIEAQHGLALVTRLLDAAEIPPGVDVAVLAQLVLGVVVETALLVAHADDPDAMRARAEPALLVLLAGLVASP